MPKPIPLSDRFIPSAYHLGRGAQPKNISLTIVGKRVGRPSKRLALHQTGLKITDAKIIYRNRNKEIEYSVDRINHLPSIQEVRLHTAQTQFPGDYLISLEFLGKDLDEIRNYIKSEQRAGLRTHLPSIDDPLVREQAEFNL